MAQKNGKPNVAIAKASNPVLKPSNTTTNKSKATAKAAGATIKLPTKPKTEEKPTSKSVVTTNVPTRSVENFILVWLDANIVETNSEYRNSLNKLRQIVSMIKTFTNTNACIDFLLEIKEGKLFFIVSGALAQTILPRLQSASNVDSIYVFCGNKGKYEQLTNEWNKVKGVVTVIDSICDALKRDLQQCSKSLTPISILAASDTSNRDLNELDASFMYSQLLKEILLELKYDNRAKKELVDFCRVQYQYNSFELEIIDEFEAHYEDHSPIWWYTRECFTYTMMNRALRKQEIDIILKMGFFIRDLHRQIEQLQLSAENQNPMTVYRGQGMLNEEFEKIKNSKGGLLSFNSFLSTSIERKVSLVFAKTAQQNPELKGILFRIEIDPSIASTPFAQITQHSFYAATEKEVLFSMHSVFRIGDIEPIENGLWQVTLTLTSDNDQQLKRLTELIRKEIGTGTGWYRLSQLMIKIGKFDKAAEISKALLNAASDTDARTIATCHHQLGCVGDAKGDLTGALLHYKKSLEISQAYLSADDPSLASTYANIGTIYQKQGDLDIALKYFQRALTIDSHAALPDHLQIAAHYNNIGLIFKRQNKDDDALKHYERALEIKLTHLPPRHPSLATAYSNISGIYQSRKDYAKALSYLEKTLEIKQKSLPPHHPSLIITYRNMATALDGLRRYGEAVQHAQHAVDIARQAFGNDHSEVIENQEYLDELRRKL